MKALRWAVRIHKWVALVVGLQLVLWIAGGLVMSAIPIERVRGEHKIAESGATLVNPEALISVEAAANNAGLQALAGAELGHLLDTPVWRLTSTDGAITTVAALTGQLMSPIDEQTVRAIAMADFAPEYRVSSARLLADPPTEYDRAGPVWQVSFEDAGNTTLYIDPDRATMTSRRSSTWRFYDFFW